MKLGNILVTRNNGTGSRKAQDVSDFLSICLVSYFQNTEGEWPFVIIDDCSTDDSVKIIKECSNDTITLIGQDFDQVIVEEEECSLNKGSAYKLANSSAVYYITEDCTKRYFSN